MAVTTSSTATVPTGERAAPCTLCALCAPSAAPPLRPLVPHLRLCLVSPRLTSPRLARRAPRSCATACAGCVQQTMPGCTRCGERFHAPSKQTLTLFLWP